MENKIDNQSSVDEKQLIHFFRQEIDKNIEQAKSLKTFLTAGGREISIVYTKLQEAKMWAGKVLEELGSELPAQYQDKFVAKPEENTSTSGE